MPNLKPIEIILILLVVLLLFGAKRLPDLARGVGKSLRIFKDEVKDLRDDDKPSATAATPESPATGVPPTATPASPYRDPVTHAQGVDETERKQV